MASKVIYLDKESKPYLVFHRYGREAWTHAYGKECELCDGKPAKEQRNKVRDKD